MTKRKRVHYTLCSMQNIELCRCLCNENNVVTKDNVTSIESNVTCQNCLRILKNCRKRMKVKCDEKIRLCKDETKKTEQSQKTKEESNKGAIRLLDVFDKVVDDSFKDMSRMFSELDKMHDNKKIVKVEIKKTFDDGTHTTKIVNMRR